MAFLKARDTITGQEGTAFASINGVVEEMFYIKKIEATAEKQKAEVKTLGRRGVQHKAIGWSGTGNMTVYYVTSKFRQMMHDYIKTGKDTYFDVMITNADPSSSVGRQSVTLKGVNLNSIIMALLDTDAETLEEEVEFTFEDVVITESFKAPRP
ncbi:phage tail tube protein [Paenibacillus daejeonensis]|uniref:phage tail tube protein n=1 Tax=Paenibacillus daejeonensis TaxID=135193 RepID=UPI00036B9F67|nr:phage tail tube protein [Paenibacillus daejeonensis]